MFEWNTSFPSTSAADALRGHGMEVRVLGAWSRLRPMGDRRARAPGAEPSEHTGLLSSIVAWCRGEGRLMTLVATLPTSQSVGPISGQNGSSK
jgi:hypothetical protein